MFLADACRPTSVAEWPLCMNKILSTTEHRPWPLPKSPWVMTQRWNDLLFAHWPLPAAELTHLLPESLTVDTFDGIGLGRRGAVLDGSGADARRCPPFPEPTASRNSTCGPTCASGTRIRQASISFRSTPRTRSLSPRRGMFYRLPYYWARMKIESDDGAPIPLQQRPAAEPARSALSRTLPQPGQTLRQRRSRELSHGALCPVHGNAARRPGAGQHPSFAMAAGAGRG